MGVWVNVAPNGRMVLPADIRKRLGVAKGGALMLNEHDGRLELSSRDQAIAYAQELSARYTGHLPNSTVDDFLAERRRDGSE